ncbi:MAG: ABC transporter permease [Chitinophagaceae bacterium]
MLLNNFKIAWRNFLKDRQFTVLNLFGLAIGLACALIIYLWIQDESGMDKYNEQDDNLYQVMHNIKSSSGIETIEYTPGLLAAALTREIPDVAAAVTVVPPSWFGSEGIVTGNDHKFKAKPQFVSPDFFSVFTCPVVEGVARRLFDGKQSIAISDKLAAKLFGRQSPIGKSVNWVHDDFDGSYEVVAVFKSLPANATEQFDLLMNFDLFVEKRPSMRSWGNSDPHTYLLLKDGATPDRTNTALRTYLAAKDKNIHSELFLRKFSDQYLCGQYADGKQTGGRITYVKLFTGIGIFILLLACINFMNLSTARAARRIKEVGIQKTMGATRGRLVIQFLTESVVMSIVALLAAFALAVLLLPAFNTITGKSLSIQFNFNLLLAALVITLFTGIFSGSYPAFYISGFKPVAVLKGPLRTSVAELWTRKGLVVFQFSLSIFAIATVLIMYDQFKYIQSRNLGYNRENIVRFEIPMGTDSLSALTASAFLNELRTVPGVVNVSSYYHNLTGGHGSIGDFQWPGKDPDTNIDFINLEVGENFAETVGIELKEGRHIIASREGMMSPSREIVFNEAAIRAMGLKDPVGKVVKFWDRERTIVGVAKDFHFESLYQKVKPCFFQVYPVMPNVIAKIQAGAEARTLQQIRTRFDKFSKGLPFEYNFLDDEYRAMYSQETKVATLAKYFAGLAVLISCLGLFGLSAFTAQKRQKEIGIRKVVGASVSGIVMLLSKGFIQLICIAVVIALPLVYWTMNAWLDNFAYRSPISATAFVVTIIGILLVSLATISFQSVKVALSNPVKSLRNE